MKNPWKDALTKKRMDGLDLTIMVMPGKPEMEMEMEKPEGDDESENAPEVKDEEESMLDDGRMKMSPLRKRAMGMK